MAASAAYCRYVIAAVTFGVVVLLLAAGLAWTAHLVRLGNLDALELAAKAATPDPVSALDWPELHVRAIIPQPDERPLVLLLVDWPAHPQRAATLLVALDYGDDRAVPLLSRWCATQRRSRRAGKGERTCNFVGARAWSGFTRYWSRRTRPGRVGGRGRIGRARGLAKFEAVADDDGAKPRC